MKKRVEHGIGRIPVLTLAAIFFKGCQALQETGKMPVSYTHLTLPTKLEV